MNIRPSRVLRKIRAGGIASCTKLNLSDPRAAEIAAICGFDCVWTDMEHVPNSIHDVENQVRAAKMHGVDTLVRVRRGSYSDMILPLEMDAAGIMVPHMMGLEDAKTIVRHTKFHPIGRRPLDGGNADGAYCQIPIEDYVKQCNQERFVIVQIEDPEPLDQIEEIAALPGIDMLFFGPGDFTHSLGIVGQFGDPRIEQTRKRVAQVARANGKMAGTVCGTGDVGRLGDMGYQFLSVGADVVALTEYFQKMVSAFGGTQSRQVGGIYSGKKS
ncbi:MAG: aldolase [Phycisphaerales bacterium]|jgi:4-hydroxy-2-oxoheptanedioate aldolase|nr:aldolase [Phycisphaerales bacterium]